MIDFGQHKEVAYSAKFKCPVLLKTNVSRASALQRTGRCGRLMPVGYTLAHILTILYNAQMSYRK